jgi:hypothetical protein
MAPSEHAVRRLCYCYAVAIPTLSTSWPFMDPQPHTVAACVYTAGSPNQWYTVTSRSSRNTGAQKDHGLPETAVFSKDPTFHAVTTAASARRSNASGLCSILPLDCIGRETSRNAERSVPSFFCSFSFMAKRSLNSNRLVSGFRQQRAKRKKPRRKYSPTPPRRVDGEPPMRALVMCALRVVKNPQFLNREVCNAASEQR